MNEIVIKIEGLKELTEALQALAKVSYDGASVPAVTTVQAPAVPVQQQAPTVPVQQPAAPIPTAPAPMAAQQPFVAQVPTTAVPQQYSFDQLAVALSNVCGSPGGQAQVHTLLQQFGVNALFDLPKDKYGDFATALRGIGGVL